MPHAHTRWGILGTGSIAGRFAEGLRDVPGAGFRVGELSDAVTTSFIAMKNLGTFGDAGAVLTDDAEVARTIRRLRNHGSEVRGRHSMGYNSRLDDLHAGILSVKLRHLRHWTDGRRAWAERYAQGLRGASGLVLPTETAGSRHARHLYVVHTREPELRNDLLDFLTASGIEVKCHYPVPIHLQAGFPWDRHATIHGPLTNAERNAACCVSLPLFPELTAGEVDYVVERVTAWDRAVASG